MSKLLLKCLSVMQQHIEKKTDREINKQYVFMFHSICERPKWYNALYCMTPDSFEKMVVELKRRKYRFLSVKELRYRAERKEAYFTFDDGFSDFYNNAYPILVKYNIPFTIFITLGYIGRKNYLTWEQVIELSQHRLCSLGGHTYTHKKLSQCTLAELKKEIVDAKCILENKADCPVKYFAYPYGSLTETHILAPFFAKVAGYEKAFSTIDAPVSNGQNFFIPRININERNWKRKLMI